MIGPRIVRSEKQSPACVEATTPQSAIAACVYEFSDGISDK
jgi:hypothetical protein